MMNSSSSLFYCCTLVLQLLIHIPTSFTFTIVPALSFPWGKSIEYHNYSNQKSALLDTANYDDVVGRGITIDTSSGMNEDMPNVMSEKIIQAAADLTTSTSSLLGIKSVGVDYGLVRTGIAVSNGYNPLPLSILSNLNNTQLCSKIIKYVESENSQQVVMGLPFHRNGTEAEQTTITRNFASQLNCALCAHFGFDSIPIYLWDERYTSKEAESRIRAANPNAGLLYKDLDADSASIILEYYYGDNGEGAEKVELPDNDEIKFALEQAWAMKKEEQRKAMKALKDERMNAGNKKQELMEKARLLDAQLAMQRGNGNGESSKKGKKKKKKKKRSWITLTPTPASSSSSSSSSSSNVGDKNAT